MSGSLIAELVGPNLDVYVERTISNWIYSKVGNKIVYTYDANNQHIVYISYQRANNSEVIRLLNTYTDHQKTHLLSVERIV